MSTITSAGTKIPLEPVKLDPVSLRCIVAASLAGPIAAAQNISAPADIVEVYYDVLKELRRRPIYPPLK